MKIEVDYKWDFLGNTAYVVKTWDESGVYNSYTSPFIFESTEDAYHAACIDISNK